MFARAGGRCEACGALVGRIPYSIHHRRPRAIGGSRDAVTNSPANLLLLCGTGTTGCHGWFEAHRTDAFARGFIVLQSADPRNVPVMLSDGRVVSLTESGDYTGVRMSE